MLFTSYSFFAFAGALLLLYYTLPRRLQWPLLLAASYAFYFIAGLTYPLYLSASIVTVWYAAGRVGQNAAAQKAYLKAHKDLTREEKKAYKAGQDKVRRRWTAAALLVNLGILAVVKYANFAIANLNGLLRPFGAGPISFWNIAVPMGISFYTFQAVGYLIDVYRGTVEPEKNLFRFALFVSFFPQLVQGPISRYGDLSRTLYGEHPFQSRTVCRGLQRMLWGYFKKLVVADRLLTAVSALTGDPVRYGGAYAAAALLLYTVELYADFTGGIDVTIGLAEALGVTVAENFNRPYFSKSLKEYWRRWHISMASWFRDYVFYPVSTSGWMRTFTKFTRARLGDHAGRRLPVYVSTFLVWLATGVWHGASWNFIVWGLLNWAVLMISEECEPLYAKFHGRFHLEGRTGWKVFQIARTFALVCVLNLFDCYVHVGDTLRSLLSVFTVHNWRVLTDGSLLSLGLNGADYGAAAFGCALMLAVSLIQRRSSVRDQIAARPYAVRFLIWYGLFVLTLLLGAYGIGYDASQFIYNRF